MLIKCFVSLKWFSVAVMAALYRLFCQSVNVSLVQFLVFHKIARHAIQYPAAQDDLWRSKLKMCQDLQSPGAFVAAYKQYLAALVDSWREIYNCKSVVD